MAESSTGEKNITFGIGQTSNTQISYKTSNTSELINSEPVTRKEILFQNTQVIFIEYRNKFVSNDHFGFHIGMVYDFEQKSKSEFLISKNYSEKLLADRNRIGGMAIYILPMGSVGPFYGNIFPLPGLMFNVPNIEIPDNEISGNLGWVLRVGVNFGNALNIDYTLRGSILTLKNKLTDEKHNGELSLGTLAVSYNF